MSLIYHQSNLYKVLVISKLYIPPSQTFTLEEKLILETGDSIWVESQVGGRVTVTVTYTDI